MAWTTVPGLTGKIYIPNDDRQPAKHACKTCFSCQWCDENRCRVCQSGGDAGETNEHACYKHKQPVQPANIEFQTPNHK